MIARMAYPQPPPGGQWWGQQPPPTPGFYPPNPAPRQTNTMAIVALVTAFFFAPLGIVFGHIALSQIQRSDEDGRGLAIAGLVVGYVFTGLYILMIVLWVAMFAWVTTEIDKLPRTPTTYGRYSMPAPTWISPDDSTPTILRVANA
jgi:peptidyl-prolyl cis-trans isomerase B (cyclophilin B)